MLRIARGVDSPDERPATPAAGSRSFAFRTLVATLPKETSAALRFLVVIARDVRTLRLQTMCAIALGMD